MLFSFALSFFPLLFPSQDTLVADVWTISEKKRDLQFDGFVEEWTGVPALVLAPDAPGVSLSGDFGRNDVEVRLQALWDRESLYVAVTWTDDVWDVQQVSRREAVWVDPERRRRDRMFFFDNLRFEISDARRNFLLWVSPRVEDRGPFLWHRLLEGLGRRELATSPPMVVARHRNGTVTMEILFSWRQLRLRPRAGLSVPLTLVVADSDLPDRPLEAKVEHLKALEWEGRSVLEGSR